MTNTFELRIFARNEADKAPLRDFLTGNFPNLAVVEHVDGMEVDLSLDFVAAWSSLGIYSEQRSELVTLAGILEQQCTGLQRTEIHEISQNAWQDCWQEDFRELCTEHFVVGPNSPRDGRHWIQLKPGRAFGAGNHAATEVILRALEAAQDKFSERLRNAGFLDLGTGTGILAIAAHKLGFSNIHATDIDPEILREAGENFAQAKALVTVHLLEHAPTLAGPFGVVCANILAPVLKGLLPEMSSAMLPGGFLFLSGFIAKEWALLAAVAAANGLECKESHDVRGWLAVVLQREF